MIPHGANARRVRQILATPASKYGVKPPRADPSVTVEARGWLPPKQVAIEEIVKRAPYMNNVRDRQWLDENLVWDMPAKKRGESSQDRCGICSSNFFGMPVLFHSQELCPISMENRLEFVATNSRAYCPSCRGRSESHKTCSSWNRECVPCRERGFFRYHSPYLGICHLQEETLVDRVEEIRVNQYKRLSRLSYQEPFLVRLDNDEPWVNRPLNYGRYLGWPAYVDINREIIPVSYEQGSTYQGIIPVQNTIAREEFERNVFEECKTFYLFPPPNYDIPQDIQLQIDEYKKALREDEEERLAYLEDKKRRMQRARFPQDLQVMPPMEEPYSSEVSLVEEFYLYHLLTNTCHQKTTELIYEKSGFPGKEGFFDVWDRSNKLKMKAIRRMDKKLKLEFEEAASKALGFPEPCSIQTGYTPNKEVLTQNLKDCVHSQDEALEVVKLQKSLVGVSEDYDIIKKSVYWRNEGRIHWEKEYLDVLMKLSYAILDARNPSTVKVAKVLDQFDVEPKEGPIQMPTSEIFLQVKKEYRREVFTTWIANVMELVGSLEDAQQE